MAAQEEQGQRVVVLRRAVVGGSGAPGSPTATSRRRRALSLRHRSVSRREATASSQPRGLSGNALLRPLHRGRQQRLLDRVLAGVELPVPAHEHAEDLRREVAQQVLDALAGAHISNPASAITGRTSTPAYRASGICAASSWARSMLSQSTT